jgi:DNA-binding FrmR family transcriptional regulator
MATAQPTDPLQNRMKRIQGQVEGLGRMIEQKRYCVDILTQIAAVRSALDALGVSVLSNHIEHCVAGQKDAHSHAHPEAAERSPAELAEEVRLVLSRFLK